MAVLGNRNFRLIAIFVLAIPLLTSPGCSCRKTPAVKTQAEKDKEKKEQEEKEKTKPKANFEVKQLLVQPGDATTGVKPGHWTSASQEMKANNFDFSGDLASAAVDSSNTPLTLERTVYRMETSRPAALPKGQTKHFETTFFIPRREDGGSQPGLLAKLQNRAGGQTVYESPFPTTKMEDYQYYLVVLARTPDSYAWMKTIDSVRPPRGDFGGPFLHYRVVLPKLEKHVPLPSNPLLWTSTAYLVWDDINPDLLTAEQQASLVDWLHWGGQVIVSGPGSLETLKASFLGKYLPALPGKPVKLEQAAFDELNANYTLPGKEDVEQPLTINDAKPPEGVELLLQRDAQYVPLTGELLAEKQIGRGRIVVTSFALSSPQIINWRGFDGFFNSCLLRRPARKFLPSQIEDVQCRWADPRFESWGNDARLTSGLRYFTRDMGYLQYTGVPLRREEDFVAEEVPPWLEATELANEAVDPAAGNAASTALVDDWLTADPLPDRGFRESPQSGVAGWNDFSGASEAARRSLREAAGISVPKREFVLRVLAIYLVVLVPVNWLFFRLIGRVEWAWIAAPLIAIAGAVAVVRLAQLDIGFARSRTELAVLELQGNHERGHLTRYTALYTSLSTSYDTNFDDLTAVAQPLATDPEFQKLRGQGISTVSFRRDSGVSLRGFRVASNSTGMLHSEQMLKLGGGIELRGDENSGYSVVNGTKLTLRDVGLLRRVAGFSGVSHVEVCWIGELKPQQKAEVKFASPSDSRAVLAEWESSPATAARAAVGEVSLAPLLDLARDPRRLAVGDVSLIGWTDEEMPGVSIRPRASQSTYRTLVIARLKYGSLAYPEPDENTHAAVASIVPSIELPPEDVR